MNMSVPSFCQTVFLHLVVCPLVSSNLPALFASPPLESVYNNSTPRWHQTLTWRIKPPPQYVQCPPVPSPLFCLLVEGRQLCRWHYRYDLGQLHHGNLYSSTKTRPRRQWRTTWPIQKMWTVCFEVRALSWTSALEIPSLILGYSDQIYTWSSHNVKNLEKNQQNIVNNMSNMGTNVFQKKYIKHDSPATKNNRYVRLWKSPIKSNNLKLKCIRIHHYAW